MKAPGSTDSERRDPFEEVAEEFLARCRSGEDPSVSEYAAEHPEIAEKLRELLPTLRTLEGFGPGAHRRRDACLSGVGSRARLGEYRILREIGRGGMGVVYEAEQETLGRRVALKVLPEGHLASQVQIERFRLEARAAARLHHTNIVPVFGVGEQEGLRYYAMQFIDGYTLSHVLDEVRRLKACGSRTVESRTSTDDVSLAAVSGELAFGRQPPADSASSPSDGTRETSTTDRSANISHVGSDTSSSTERAPYSQNVARIGMQVAEALAYAHDEGILHRDIKPSNLILDARGTVWVTDFGLAKADDSNDLTASDAFVGTARYVAPERLRGEGDARSDVYSLGVTLYELLTLRNPFEGTNRVQTLDAIARREPTAPRKLDRTIPRDLETIVLKALAKDPRARYSTSRELANDLRRFLNCEPVSARRTTLVTRTFRWCQRNPVVAGMTITIASLIVLLAIVGTSSAFRLKLEKDRVFEQLFSSKLEEARAWRRSDRAGRRLHALAALRTAARGEQKLDVRNEVIGALALWDAEEVSTWSRDGLSTYFSRDLSIAARLQEDGTVAVLDVNQPHRTVSVLPAYGGLRYGVWSPSARWLAVKYAIEAQQPTTIWDVQKAEAVLTVQRVASAMPIDFDPDETRIAHALDDGTILMRTFPDGEIIWKKRGRGTPLRQLSFDPNGHRLAVTQQSRTSVVTEILDTRNGETLQRLHHPDRVDAVAWHPSGRRLAVSCRDFRVYVWDAATYRRIHTLEGHRGEVVRVKYSHNGELLASYGWDNRTILWSSETGARLFTVFGALLGFSADDRQFALRFGGTIVGTKESIWQLHYGEEFTRLSVPVLAKKGPFDIDLSPDGYWLAAAAGRSGARVWCTESPDVVAQVEVGNVDSAHFEPDGSAIWLGGDSLVRLPLAESTDQGCWQLGPPEDTGIAGRRVAFDARGEILVTLNAQGLLRVFDGRPPWKPRDMTFKHAGATWLDVSASGRWLVTGTWQGRHLRVWDLQSGALTFELEAKSARGVFSPDERWLVVGTGPRYTLYATRNWKEKGTIDRPDAFSIPGSIVFSQDSSSVALAVTQSRVDLYRVGENWGEIARFTPPNATIDVTDFALHPHGRRLFAGTYAKTVEVWDLDVIRNALRELDLDWEAPTQVGAPKLSTFHSLRVDYGDDDKWHRIPERRKEEVVFDHIELYSNLLETESLARHHLERAQGHELLGDWDNGLADIERAIVLSPGAPEAYEARARLLARMGRREAALGDLDTAIVLHEKKLDNFPIQQSLLNALTQRAELRRDLGQFVEAAVDEEAILQLSPGNTAAARRLAWTWVLADGRKCRISGERAEALAQQVVAVEPNDPSALRTLGAVLTRLGKFEAANRVLEKVEVESKTLDGAWTALFKAFILVKRGEPASAEQHRLAVMTTQRPLQSQADRKGLARLNDEIVRLLRDR